jgi:VCBS repeat-containing protein
LFLQGGQMIYVKKSITRSAIAFIAILFLILGILPGHILAAGDETTVGTLTLTPAFVNISVISAFSGDNNGNNQATLYYKLHSASTWIAGVSMTVDRRSTLTQYGSGTITNNYQNQWRAVIFGVSPNTAYDVKVDYTDSNGVSGTAQGSVTTRNDNPASSGNTYYVSTSGSDSGTGSSSSPWKTIAKAASMVSAGDTVRILAGTYTETISLSKSGTATNYITFTSDNPSNPATVRYTNSNNQGVFYLKNISYVRIKNLNIDPRGSSDAGVRIEGNSVGNIVEDCLITLNGSRDWWSGGVYLNGSGYSTGPTNTLVQRNTITNTLNERGGDGPFGVCLYSTGGGTVVCNNTITGGWEDAIGGANNFNVNGGPYQNSFFYGNNIEGIFDDGIEAEGGGINCAVFNNTIISHGGNMGFASAPVIVGPMYVVHNSCVINEYYSSAVVKLGSSSYGFEYFYHNVFYQAYSSNNMDGIATYGSDSISRNQVFRNNIILNNNGRCIANYDSTAGQDFDWDLIYSPSGSTRDPIRWPGGGDMTWSSWRSAYNQESHGIWQTPNFVDQSGYNFSLQSSSPCIDSGVVITGINDANSPWPYKGNAPDIGAFEYNGSSSSNHAPVAAGDSYSTNENTALTVSSPGVLGNDTDADGDSLTASQVSGPSHGSLSLAGSGSFTYTPTTNYSGTDTFTYRAYDGKTYSSAATVTITINGTNHAPVANNDTYSTNNDTNLNVNAPGVLGNDTDADGDSLTGAIVNGPFHGTATLSGNGSFVYSPSSGYSGTDSFTYRAYDGQAYSSAATVTITINATGGTNHTPVATNDSYSTNANTALTRSAPGVLSNDTDADGDSLTASQVSGPSHGTLSLASNGSFTYTPTTSFTGTDSFTYRAYDSQAYSSAATVTITINATGGTNHTPVATNDSYSTNANTALTRSAPGVLSNDTDADGDSLTASQVSGPSHGTLSLASNGSFTYTPTTSYTGTDSFTYRAYDGQAYSNTATVTITINASSSGNTPPIAVDNTYYTSEDAILTRYNSGGVLSNDTDADGDSLTAILVTNTSHGSVTLNSDGSFTYTPSANYNGMDSFTYQANDGHANSNVATVSIYVSPINDAPVLAPIGDKEVVEGTTLSFTVSATDPDGDPLTYSAYNLPEGASFNSANQVFTWTPTAEQIESYSYVRFEVRDARYRADYESITINVDPATPSGNTGGGGDNSSGSGSSGGGSGSGDVTSLINTITQDGQVVSDVVATSEDQEVKLVIPKNTIVKSSSGGIISAIHIKPTTSSTSSYPNAKNIGSVYDLSPSGTTFDPPATLVFGYSTVSLPPGIRPDNLFVAQWDPESGEWLKLGGTVDMAGNTISVNVQHLSIYCLMVRIDPADFYISGLTLMPEEVKPGEDVTASVIVTNAGDVTGTFELKLSLDNVIIETRSITLSGGASETETFTMTSNAIGEHQLSIMGMYGNFVVKELTGQSVATFSDLSVNPTSAEVGQNVNISVVLLNTSTSSATLQASLQIDGAYAQTKDVTLDGGASETVSFNAILNSVGKHVITIGDLRELLEVYPSPAQVIESTPTMTLTSFSVAPTFNESTQKIVFARVVYQVDQKWMDFPDAKLMLSVYHNGNLLEQVPLLTLSQQQDDGKTGKLDYIPSRGWQAGEYTFLAQLQEGTNIIYSQELTKLHVNPEAVTQIASWWTLGAVIGVATILIMMVIAVIIYRKREMLSQ